MNENKLYTIDEISETLKVSRPTIYRLFRTGVLQWIWVGTHRRVTQEQLDEFLRNGVQDDQTKQIPLD